MRIGRGWSSVHLGWHVVALAAVLAVPLWFVAGDGYFSADEGAVRAQVEVIDQRGEWVLPYGAAEIDPGREAPPMENVFIGADGEWAPFAKQAPYVVVLRVASQVAGETGFWLVGWLGAVLASLGSALLARRLAPGLAIPALWACGVASPLLFDGYLLIAHSLAAALAAFATLLVLDALAAERTAAVAAALGALVLLIGLVVLRTEGALFALALGAAAAATAFDRRAARKVAAVVLAGAIAVVVVGARRLERTTARWAWGAPDGSGLGNLAATSGDAGSALEARLESFTNTVLLPSHSAGGVAVVGLVGAGLVLIAAVAARREDDPGPIVRLLALGAAIAYLVRLVEWTEPVRGLAVACPLLFGVVGLGRELLRPVTSRVLAVTAASFAAAVLLTQYPQGGFIEWGGRYFAVGLPIAIPIALLGARALAERLDPSTRRWSAGAGGVVVAALAVLALASLDHAQESNDELADAVASSRLAAGGGAVPVLTTNGGIGRIAWPTALDGAWLATPRSKLGLFAGRLADTGSDVLLVTFDPARDLPVVEERFVATPLDRPELWLLTPRPPP